MADDYQIRRVFQGLGALFAAEHEEHDDAGAMQVHRLIKRLQKFAKHEHAEQQTKASAAMFGAPVPAREAAYDLADGRSVWYDAGDAVRDAVDLYSVLGELHGTGSPNLENSQARDVLERLQSGAGLGEVHVGTLRRLLAKHAAAIDAFRRRDREGQDMLDMASAGPDSRIITTKGA